MSNVTIENYRGIEIWFNTSTESFQCDIDDERSIKKSYLQIKKFIDEWKKDTANFKSFNVEANPLSMYGGKYGRIIGIRKDSRFILETKEGKKEQVADYNMKDFILVVPENKEPREELEAHEKEVNEYRIASDKKRKEIVAKFKITTLKDIKTQYTGEPNP